MHGKVKNQSQARELSNLKLQKLPPYHLFKIYEDYFVFDTTGCRFYKIDELTSDFLMLSLSLSINDAAKTLIASGKYEKDKIIAVKKEIVYLSRHGLFDKINSYINIRSVKKSIEACNINDAVMDIQLALSENCNLACKYCYCAKNYDVSQSVLMPEHIAKKMIDFLVSQRPQKVEITMFGGEPLLNKPVIDFIMSYSKREDVRREKQISYIITTNATLLDDKTIDYIVNDNFGLMVSLDGPKALHDAQCPTKSGKGSFDIATKNIKKIMQRRTVSVRATMTHPMPNLKELVDFFINFGFFNIVIGTATNRVDAPSDCDFDQNDMKEYCQQQEELLPWALEYLKQGKKPPYFIFERWYNSITTNTISKLPCLFNCGAGTAVIGVDAKGNFFPCAKFIGLNNWIIGGVEKGVDIVKCKLQWERYIEAIAPYCGKCWAYPLCHGPCIWECAREDGSIVFNNNYCDFMKKSIERSAYLSLHQQNSLDDNKLAIDQHIDRC